VPNYKEASDRFLPLTEQFLELSRRLDYVKAFWIHGSRSVGRHIHTSDIDYLFVLDDAQDKKDFEKELSNFVDWKDTPGFFPEQTWRGCRWNNNSVSEKIGMHIYTQNEVNNMFADLFNNEPMGISGMTWLERWQNTRFLGSQGQAQFMVRESVPVYDPHDILPKLRDEVDKYSDEFSQQIVDMMTRYLEIKLQWFGDPWIPRSKYSFMVDVKEILYFIAAAHYAKNKAFMQQGLKRYHLDLEGFKPDIRKDLDRLLAVDDKFGTEDKAQYLKNIISTLRESNSK
jgi:predicted nucleotidyltransferase